MEGEGQGSKAPRQTKHCVSAYTHAHRDGTRWCTPRGTTMLSHGALRLPTNRQRISAREARRLCKGYGHDKRSHCRDECAKRGSSRRKKAEIPQKRAPAAGAPLGCHTCVLRRLGKATDTANLRAFSEYIRKYQATDLAEKRPGQHGSPMLWACRHAHPWTEK